MDGVVASTRQDGALCRIVAFVAVALAAVLALGAPVAAAAPPAAAGPMTQVFGDEFNASALDTSVWTPGWMSAAAISGPMSDRCVAKDNVTQSGDGVLRLKLTLPNGTCALDSGTETGALVESSPADGVAGHAGFSFTYGYVEWRAQLPAGNAECPTTSCVAATPQLWSMPGDAVFHSFEIDTMEGQHGNACWNTHGVVADPGTPPFGAPAPGCAAGSPLVTGFHTYGALWTPSGVEFFYDGQKVGDGRPGIHSTNEPQFLVMDLINATSFVMTSTKELQVDWVHVWQTDSDGDGVPDASDRCPSVQGPAASHGCPPPTATTGTATGIGEAKATLTSTVDPYGDTDASYHFEYGLTTSYDHSTAAEGTGSALGSHAYNKTISALAPNRTYHYRIVAEGTGGRTNGADHTFTTLAPESSPQWLVRDSSTNNQWLYFRGSSGVICADDFDALGWHTGCPGSGAQAAAAGSVPVAVRDSAGNQWVYYRGTNGAVCALAFAAGSGWSSGCHTEAQAIAANSSPTAVRDASGNQWIYYQGTNSAICALTFSAGGGWSSGCQAGLAAQPASTGSSPSVVRDPQTGNQWIYYAGSNGAICNLSWDSSSWSSGCSAGLAAQAVASGTSPAVMRNPGTGAQWIYYHGTNNAICGMSFDASAGWSSGCQAGLAAQLAATGTSPTALRDASSGNQWIYYQGTSHALCGLNFDGSWHSGCQTGQAIGSANSPIAVRDETSGNQWIYYQDSAASVWGYSFDAAGWQNGQIS